MGAKHPFDMRGDFRAYRMIPFPPEWAGREKAWTEVAWPKKGQTGANEHLRARSPLTYPCLGPCDFSSRMPAFLGEQEVPGNNVKSAEQFPPEGPPLAKKTQWMRTFAESGLPILPSNYSLVPGP
jgi:hypothetical protein